MILVRSQKLTFTLYLPQGPRWRLTDGLGPCPRPISLFPLVPRRLTPTPPRSQKSPRIISDFDEGVLDAAPGVSLRTLLASKLHCDVMRVSKKFKGWACVGKRSFRPVHHLDGRTAKVRAGIASSSLLLCMWYVFLTAANRSSPVVACVRAMLYHRL